MRGADEDSAGLLTCCYCTGAHALPKAGCPEAAAFVVLLLISNAFAANEPGAQTQSQVSPMPTCPDCGVVRSLREIRTERPSRSDTYLSSSQYLQSRQFD